VDAAADLKIVDILAQECRDVALRITTYLTLGERILTIASGILTLSMTVAASYGRPYYLMALPFVYCLLLTYVFYLNTEAISLGGYKSALELEMTRRLGVPTICWESQIARRRHVDIPAKSVRTLFVCLLLGFVTIGIYQAFATLQPGRWGHERAALYIALTLASVVIGLSLVVTSFIAEMRVHKHVEAITTSAIREHRLIGQAYEVSTGTLGARL